MPGERAPLVSASRNSPDKQLTDELKRDIHALSQTIGPRRHGHADSLERTVAYITQQLQNADLPYTRHVYQALDTEFVNLVVEHRGERDPRQVIVVGAHYDTVAGSPGADDNASGVAALLALARRSRLRNYAKTIRFVAFANEELPYSNTDAQGALRYAKEARMRGDNIVGMLSLESIGYYKNEKNSQRYPAPLSWFYPNTGNFIAFVGDMGSRAWVTRAIRAFRRAAQIPSEGVAAPRMIADISRSDHSAFWEQGYPAFMLTDTAPFRNPHYHRPSDLPGQIDYLRLAQVVSAMQAMLSELASQ